MMKTDATKFYYVKLRNLFLAHQETYEVILKDDIDNAKKIRFQKKLLLLESQIKKLLTEKCSSKLTFNERQINESSTYFAINKGKYCLNWLNQKKLVSKSVKNSPDNAYFVTETSKPSLTLEKTLNAVGNTNGSDVSKFMDCLDEKLSNEELDDNFEDSRKASITSLDDENEAVCVKGNDESESDGSIARINIECERNDTDKLEFFKAIGLLSRDEYNEVTSRKNSRKRRTTANPQFSSAALEAKRVTKMEIIAERKNRRQLATEKQNSFKHLKNSTDSRFANKSTSRFLEDKTKNLFKIENKQLCPGLYLVKRISNTKYYCKVCEGQCQCSVDTIIVCKKCSAFFHLTCVIPKKEMSKSFELNCPVCTKNSSVLTDTLTCTGERNELLKRLNELRKYIVTLTQANQIVQSLVQKRQSEKSQLLHEIDVFHNKTSLMKACFANFDLDSCGNSSLDVSSESSSNVQTDSSETSLNVLNQSNQSDSANCGHLMEQSSADEFDVMSSLYSHSNNIYNSDSAPKCDTDLPVISFCA